MLRPQIQPHPEGCAFVRTECGFNMGNRRIHDKSFSVPGTSQTLLKLWYKKLRGGTRHEAMDHRGDGCGGRWGCSGVHDPNGEGVFGRQGGAFPTTQDGAIERPAAAVR